MKKFLGNIGLTCLFLILLMGCAEKDYLVTIKTPYGDMKAVLYDDTPQHKENFIKLAKAGDYDSTIFHRVMQGFMIQGGDVNRKENAENKIDYTIPAEFVEKYHHKKGALAAARQPDQMNPEKASSGCQFYIVQGNVYPDGLLNVDAQKLNNGIRQVITKPENDSLYQEVLKIQRSRDMGAMNEFMAQMIPVVESELGISLEAEDKMSEERIKDYVTIGGSPHLDDDYTVFGELVDGMAVIDSVAAQQVGRANKPLKDIFMTVEVEEVSRKQIEKKYGYSYPESKK